MPPRAHDLGGRPAGPIDRTEHVLADWEVLADGLAQALGAAGIRTTDEHRRVREDALDSPLYAQIKYYERWIVGTEEHLVELGILSREEIDRKAAELEERWGAP